MDTSFNRRKALLGATALSAGSLFGRPAWAQQKVLRIVVGFPAGGTADRLARVLAPLLATPGQTVIVENKPGASGQIAADATRQAPPDGNTLLLTPSSVLSMVPLLYKKPMYDSRQDFAPVGCVCDHSFGFAVPGNSPFQTLADFAAWAKKNPSEATYATPGPGSGPHFLGTLWSREIGVPLAHVPYKGVAPGLQDLMGGQIASTFNPLPTMLEFHRAGRIRILGVTNPNRVASIPAVPTFTESGFSAVELVEWYGLFTSSKVSEVTLALLQSQLSQALSRPEIVPAARSLEVEPKPVDAAGLKRLLEIDIKHWSEVVKATGIQLES